MSILNLQNIGHSFANFDVFAGISASIPNDGRIGLVGPNGIGKTTLLRIIAGEYKPTYGNVHIARTARIGYLEQHALHAFTRVDNELWPEMLTVFGNIQQQEAELAKMEREMANGRDDEDFLEEYGELQHAFESAGGYDYELRIRQTLTGLGFREEHFSLPLEVMSGGQKTRALLAKLLLEQPDLLILDEPTNHLDVEAIAWLENTLQTWDGAMLVVSHDRYFLDKVVNTIWEMSRAGIEVYRGNYSIYVNERQIRWAHRQETFDREKARLLNELDFVKRNIARDSTTDRAKGRLRRLSREIVAIQELGVMALKNKSWLELGIGKVRMMGVAEAEQALKALQAPTNRPPQLNLRLPDASRSGHIILRSTDLQIGYSDHYLFEAGDLYLTRGECAALIGQNGTGKTTFLRTLMDQVKPYSGELELGASLNIGYFAQAHEKLNLDNTIIDELLHHHPMRISEARHVLGRFMFGGDDINKPISMLSGGERGRLALAILSLESANFLLLDEPTNHLDIPTQEVLQAVLETFGGTILMVTHDRYLVDRLATQIWELQGQKLSVFKGTYKQYLEIQAAERAEAKDAPKIVEAPATNGKKPTLSKNERRRLEEKASKLENKIQDLEAELVKVAEELQSASEAQNFPEIQRLGDLYEAKQHELDASMEAWAAIDLG